MDTAMMRKRGSIANISREVSVTSIRKLRSGVMRKSHAPFWSSGRRSDPPIDCNTRLGLWRSQECPKGEADDATSFREILGGQRADDACHDATSSA
jgi:hypothetical protein